MRKESLYCKKWLKTKWVVGLRRERISFLSFEVKEIDVKGERENYFLIFGQGYVQTCMARVVPAINTPLGQTMSQPFTQRVQLSDGSYNVLSHMPFVNPFLNSSILPKTLHGPCWGCRVVLPCFS